MAKIDAEELSIVQDEVVSIACDLFENRSPSVLIGVLITAVLVAVEGGLSEELKNTLLDAVKLTDACSAATQKVRQ